MRRILRNWNGGNKLFTILIGILMLMIFWKLLKFALKASWGLVKILFTIVFLPLVLVGLILAGLAAFAVPVLLILGGYAMLCSKKL